MVEAQKIGRIGTFRWNITTGELLWSDEVFRIYGYEPNYRPALELVLQRTHPDDLPRLQKYIERLSQVIGDWEIEYRLLMPDGAIKYVRSTSRTSKDAFGNFELMGSVVDITAVREAEA